MNTTTMTAAASQRGQGETRNGFRLTYSRKVDDVVYRRTN
jgi:hypothetical protein